MFKLLCYIAIIMACLCILIAFLTCIGIIPPKESISEDTFFLLLLSIIFVLFSSDFRWKWKHE